MAYKFEWVTGQAHRWMCEEEDMLEIRSEIFFF